MSASSNALKQALKRVSQRSLVDRTAARLCSNYIYYGTKPLRPFSSSSSSSTVSSDSTEEQLLYGGKPSPISEFLDLAAQGVTVTGPEPPKKNKDDRIVLECGLPEDELSFKTTSYQRLLEAPFVQHQEHKVKVSVRWDRLPLNDFEKRILMEIVGSRYNPETNELRLSSEQFGSRIENKRHLTSMLDRLVFAARKLAKEATGNEPTMASAED